MSQVIRLPFAEPPHRPAPIGIEVATVTPIEDVCCALCGTSLLGTRKRRYRLVSPFVSMGKVHSLLDVPQGSIERGIPPGRLRRPSRHCL
jgi:hypothetical protein